MYKYCPILYYTNLSYRCLFELERNNSCDVISVLVSVALRNVIRIMHHVLGLFTFPFSFEW